MKTNRFYKILLFALAIICFGENAYAGETFGYTKIQTNVTEAGGLISQVNFTLPKGTVLQPEGMSLSYNSSSGNSIAGQKWSLTGESIIIRTGSIYSRDGESVGSDPDHEYFVLDNNQMIKVRDFGTETFFFTEQHTNKKITFVKGADGRINRWIVSHRNGNKCYYEPISEEGEVFIWRMTKIIDEHGNYILYNYTQTEKQEVLLESIEYTGNEYEGLDPLCKIHFQYESRPDTAINYIAGKAFTVQSRLKDVRITVDNKQFRKYELSYIESGNESFLSQVMEYGSSSESLKPLNFVWDLGNYDMMPKCHIISSDFAGAGSFNPEKHSVHIGDIDADGDSDVVIFHDKGVYYALSNKDSLESTGMLEAWGYNIGYRIANHPRLLQDVNSDGYLDIVVFTTNDVEVALANKKGGFEQPTVWLEGNYCYKQGWRTSHHIRQLADINGDGRPDIIGFGSYAIYVALNTGNSFEYIGDINKDFIYDNGWRVGTHTRVVVDVNNDRNADILAYNTDKVWVCLSNGDGTFEEKEEWISGFGIVSGTPANHSTKRNLYLGNHNSDGLIDIYVTGCYGLHIGINTGKSFKKLLRTEASTHTNANEVYLPEFGYKTEDYKEFSWGKTTYKYNTPHTVKITDIDADGDSDLIEIRKGEGVVFYINEAGRYVKSDKPYFPEFESSKRLLVSDISGDGLVELLAVENNGIYTAGYKRNSKNKKTVTSFRIGNGSSIDVEYSLLTDSSVYNKGNMELSFPLISFQAPLQVVKAVRTKNGDKIDKISYRFEGGIFHLQGRSFRGMKKLIKTDSASNFRTEVVFDRNYKQLGNQILSERKYKGDRLLEKTENVLNFNEIGFKGDPRGVYWSYIAETYHTKYDLLGNVLSQHTILYDYYDDDYGNLRRRKIISDDKSITEEYTYRNIVNDQLGTSGSWILGLVESKTVTKENDKNKITTKTEYQYDNIGQMISEKSTHDNAELDLTYNYSYDKYGNQTAISVTGFDGYNEVTRTSSCEYDEYGRFRIKSISQNGLETAMTVNPLHGMIEKTAVAGLVTTKQYNSFGELTSIINSDGEEVTIEMVECAGEIDKAVWKSVTVSSLKGEEIRYFDISNRDIRIVKTGFNGKKVIVDKKYNKKGELSGQTVPYYEGSKNIVWRTIEYDDLGRVIVDQLGDRITKYSYDGNDIYITDARGNVKMFEKNQHGETLSLTDEEGGQMYFSYNPDGQLNELIDVLGQKTVFSYDENGKRIAMSTPVANTQETFNSFGELVKTNDRNYKFDFAGRMIESSNSSGKTKYIYDPKTGLLNEISEPNTSVKYTYDEHHRLVQTTKLIEGKEFVEKKTYYDNGLVSSVTQNDGFKLIYIYDDFSNLSEIRNEHHKPVYTVISVDAFGNIIEEQLGNGVSVSRSFNSVTNDLYDIKADNIYHMSYQFDNNGNVVSRTDSIFDLTETFIYDWLNRITNTQVGDQKQTKLNYREDGAIHYKSNVGSYIYHDQQQSVLISITSESCMPSMHADKRQLTDDGRIKRIESNGYSVDQKYCINGRYERTVFKGENIHKKTLFVTPDYHIETDSTGTVTHVHLIAVQGRVIAIHEEDEYKNSKLTYYIHDNIGSVAVMMDNKGSVLERYSFDAFGAARSHTDWYTPVADVARFGFTGQTCIMPDVIDFHARLYNCKLARFYSPDVFVQDLTNTQSYNRYVYCMNNGLKLVDLSGRSWWSKNVTRFFSKNWKKIVSVGVGLVLGFGVSTLFTSSFASAVASGAASAFGSTATAVGLNGGSLSDALSAGLKASVSGAVFGGIAHGINATFSNWNETSKLALSERLMIQTKRLLFNSAASGLKSYMQGGNFADAFKSGLTGGTYRWALNAFTGDAPTWKKGDKSLGDAPKLGVFGNVKMKGQAVVNGSAINIGRHLNPLKYFDNGMFDDSNQPFLYEGGPLSRAINWIPGMNYMSNVHDNMVQLPIIRDYDALNILTILPAIPATYVGLLAQPTN